MRKLVFNLHLYLALTAALFVILMGITGSLMAFEPEIDRLLHRKQAYVTPVGARALSFTEISAIVAGAFAGERMEAYFPSTSPELSCSVFVEKSGAVYLNPYTGQVLGVRENKPEFLDYVHQLHIRLGWQHQGDPGKKIMSWIGVAMLLLLLSGLFLWWPVKRVTVQRGAGGRRFWFDLHNTVGIFSLLFLLTLTVTGIVIGFERTTNPLLYKLTGSKPSEMPKTVPPPPPGATPIPVDQALEIARNALPGATAFAVIIPQAKGAYRIALRFPEDRTPGGRSRVMVDQYTGKVLFAEGSRTSPAGARVAIANRAIHTGDIFGIPSKTVMSLASLSLVLQACTGLVMWWKRIRAKKRSSSQAVAQGAA
jgi:uncharacterized iron-regulated membrane protein